MVVAERLFADRGFAGISLRTICSEAEISIATLLHHFESKEKLYSRVLGRIAQSMSKYIPDLRTVVDAQAVVDIADRHLDWTLAHPHYSRLIRKGQQAGALRAFDPEIFVFSFTGAIAHFCTASTTVSAFLSLDDKEQVISRYRCWLRDSTLAMLGGFAR